MSRSFMLKEIISDVTEAWYGNAPLRCSRGPIERAISESKMNQRNVHSPHIQIRIITTIMHHRLHLCRSQSTYIRLYLLTKDINLKK